jgi:site-specific DNA-methyltransferase (adenine-specific)
MILNDIVWEKPNPPANFSCRYFIHSTETIIRAARSADTDHILNYDLMRRINRGSQMQSVWRMNAPGPEEKVFGEHPT